MLVVALAFAATASLPSVAKIVGDAPEVPVSVLVLEVVELVEFVLVELLVEVVLVVLVLLVLRVVALVLLLVVVVVVLLLRVLVLVLVLVPVLLDVDVLDLFAQTGKIFVAKSPLTMPVAGDKSRMPHAPIAFQVSLPLTGLMLQCVQARSAMQKRSHSLNAATKHTHWSWSPLLHVRSWQAGVAGTLNARKTFSARFSQR